MYTLFVNGKRMKDLEAGDACTVALINDANSAKIVVFFTGSTQTIALEYADDTSFTYWRFADGSTSDLESITFIAGGDQIEAIGYQYSLTAVFEDSPVIQAISFIDSSSDMYRDGDIVTFTLGFTGVKDAKSMMFTFSYEGASAEIVGYQWLIPGVIQQFEGLEGIVAWSDAKDIDGGVFEISFRLSEDADEFTLYCDSMLNPGDMAFTASKTVYRHFYIDGDLDDDGLVTSDDAIYLLYSTFLPERYPLNQNADFNDDGIVDSDDAVYLLYHTFLPDRYPLHPKFA